MTDDEKTQVIEAHLPFASHAFVENRLRELASELPDATRVEIEFTCVETTALGDAKPRFLRGSTQLATKRTEGTHDAPVTTTVWWETGAHGQLVPLRVRADS